MAHNGSPSLRLEQLKEVMFACSRCGFCRVWDWKGTMWVCPTYPYTEAFDTQYARGRLNMAQSFYNGEAEIDETFLEHLAQCTLCGSCGVHCPVGIPLVEIWQAFRADLVDAGHVLPAHQRAADNVRNYHSVFEPRPGKRSEPKPEPRKVDVLYFPGCQTNRKTRAIGKATTELLAKLKLDFAVLEDDACCGYPMYDIGQMEVMRENGLHTAELIAQYQPSVVLTTCAGCYRALKVVYPESLGIEIAGEVQHTHEFFPAHVKDGLQTVSRKVTFHDPCVTGRHMGIYDEPRALIESIPGIELVEMYSTRENVLCCGAGGGVLNAFDGLAGDVAVERLQQAADAGAAQVLSSCPTCVLNLKRMVSKSGLDLQVVDMVELLNEAVSGD